MGVSGAHDIVRGGLSATRMRAGGVGRFARSCSWVSSLAYGVSLERPRKVSVFPSGNLARRFSSVDIARTRFCSADGGRGQSVQLAFRSSGECCAGYEGQGFKMLRMLKL